MGAFLAEARLWTTKPYTRPSPVWVVNVHERVIRGGFALQAPVSLRWPTRLLNDFIFLIQLIVHQLLLCIQLQLL
jgi:hypothetical protein